MADLKTIDEASLTATMDRLAIELHRRVRQETEACLRDVRQCARALAEMPQRTSDLIAQAEHVLVGEMDVDTEHVIGTSRLTAYFEPSVRGERLTLSADIKHGVQRRYRVIVALLPLPDEPVK